MPKKRVRASPASGRFANRPYVASPYAERKGRATSRVAHTVFRCRGMTWLLLELIPLDEVVDEIGIQAVDGATGFGFAY